MPTVFYFLLSVAALILGYFVYSRIIEKIFGAKEERLTPAHSMNDGVDYMAMPTWKVFLIQLLNIAGVGPVFGPIMGALYGPAALLWVVLGSIFAGAVHDYFSGMMSIRYHGKSLPDVVGYTLGNGFKQFMRAFSLLLLVLVGVVFVAAPAGLLANLTGMGSATLFVVIIFLYYFLATILPIDLIIGRLYPIFAVVLLIMAFGVAGGLIVEGKAFYSWAEWTNQHPKGLPLWPLMFITIACGAISGFHATQSPMMARCMLNERHGRSVFYGAMIAEGIIGLIWATAGMTFYDSAQSLAAAMGPKNNAALVVNEVCLTLLGSVGGVLAILGVVVLPITSGDTAFRAARLLIADVLRSDQQRIDRRLFIAVPLFAVGIALANVDFSILWRYFGFANQSLATVVLWSGAAYAVRKGTNHWLLTLPATFMTAVCSTYLYNATIGLNLPYDLSVILGLVSAAVALGVFLARANWFRTNVPLELSLDNLKA
ncbi:MAG: carbon starvation protein A [Desulfovibrio sp.]|jgi:carbon starvation protein CstA|nr:carbon starvation protein A [Desulfovibrio sp.]